MKFFIKNIVNLERLIYVRNELNRIGLHTISIELNEIDTGEGLGPADYTKFLQVLQQAGIELFEDKKEILVRRIKDIIMEIVYNSKEPPAHNLSVLLAEKLNHDYTYMSNLFSETQHITIERFYICHRIERAKELLLYEKMPLTEIAHRMHYSSLAHLSSQFKKVTGMTPSQFKHQYGKEHLPPENC